MLEIRTRDGELLKAPMGEKVQIGQVALTSVVEGVVFEPLGEGLKRLSVYDLFDLKGVNLDGEIKVTPEVQVSLISPHTASLSGHYLLRVEQSKDGQSIEVIEQVLLTAHFYECDGQVVS